MKIHHLLAASLAVAKNEKEHGGACMGQANTDMMCETDCTDLKNLGRRSLRRLFYGTGMVDIL